MVTRGYYAERKSTILEYLKENNMNNDRSS